MVADISGMCLTNTYKWKISMIDNSGQTIGTPFQVTTTTNQYSFSRAITNGSQVSVRVELLDIACNNSCTIYKFGVWEYSTSNSYIEISSNPFIGQIKVSMKGVSGDQENTVKVFNMKGEMIYETRVFGNRFNVDLLKEEAGMYILEISNKEGTYREKVIKN